MRFAAAASRLLSVALSLSSTAGFHSSSFRGFCTTKKPSFSLNMASASASPSSCTAHHHPALNRKDLIRKLLRGIETGDPGAAAVVDQHRYVQHNPQTADDGGGLAALFARLSKSNPRVHVVRIFQDGDYVFGHTEYDFATRRIGFEVFRFDNNTNKAVEHWDNIQPRLMARGAGGGRRPDSIMVDGPTEATDLEFTEQNRELVRQFTETVLVGRDLDQLDRFCGGGDEARDGSSPPSAFVQHDPRLEDGVDAWRAALAIREEEPNNDNNNNNNNNSNHRQNEEINKKKLDHANAAAAMRYDRLHRVLAEGNFVLAVCEGALDGVHASFYDLYRVAGTKKRRIIVEHWNTIEAVPPRSEWKNDNGKF